MTNKTYTVLIVPERSSSVRRLTIPRSLLARGALALVVIVGLAAFMGVHYLFAIDQAAGVHTLKDENVQLRARLRLLQDEVARIDSKLQRIDQFAGKVRSITQLSDPDRNLAMGPLAEGADARLNEVLYAPGERIDYEDETADSKLALRLIESKIDEVEGAAIKQERGMRELHDFFADDRSLLATTPSIRPTRSRLLSSSFGVRTDPYTNHRVMHKGIDFAADHGADVVSPADGIVIFVGSRGGYGKMVVIDHGFGVQTHYAHLSAFSVEVGQRVGRGDVVASVGNTGRSTGAHLHYEVRFNGFPQDPEKFILD